MIKHILRKSARKFGQRYDYNTAYMETIINASTSAGLRLSAFPILSQYRGPSNARDVWAGALLSSTLDGDCGPCGQLIVDMALEAGVPRDALRACIEGQPHIAGDTGLGFRFATAAIAGSLEADNLGAEIEEKYGHKAVISAAFAAASGRMYPVLKRGIGHGSACQKLMIGEDSIPVGPQT